MGPLRRHHLLALALVLALVGVVAAQERACEVVRLPLDPDRGLAPELRTRLRLADPGSDSWESERWNAALDERLGQLARLWAEGRLSGGLAQADWVDAELEVEPLLPRDLEPVLTRGAWSVARPAAEPGAPSATGLATALAAWRAAFERDARLDLEVFEVRPEGDQLVTRVRVLAGGAQGSDRLQHNALWTCRWRTREGDLRLLALRADSFDAIRLAGHAEGLFADATASLFGDQPVWSGQLALALDDWRWRLDAALEPGTLGHHGIALGDVDGDGLEDIYLAQPGGLPNRLLLHQPDDSVRDVSADAGVDLLDYTSSALLLDLDGDLDLDLLVSTGTALVLFEGDGQARFRERQRIERSLATSLAAADFDADGDLDVYVCSYLSPYEKDGLPVPYHAAENGEANVLLRNEGDWRFTDATLEVGLGANNRRFSFAAAWEDYDNDGDQDLYVANDFGHNNLYRNEGGRFIDVARELDAEDVSAGMGVTWGDVDEDGWPDLYVTNMYTPAACRLTAREGFRPAATDDEGAYRDHAMGNSLLLNQQARAFEDVADASGTSWGRWGWGSVFVDLDGDGRLDLFAPNGFSTGERRDDLDSYFWRQVVLQSPDRPGDSSGAYAQGWRAVNRLVRQGWSWNGNERNVAWLNLGAGHFADVSSATALDLPDDARAVARVDWDGDGDEDLLVSNRTAPMLRLLLNRREPKGDWLGLRLRGTRGNTAAIGARVTLTTAGGRRLIRTVRCGEGYLAQSSATLVVALGVDELRAIEVRWPGGGVEAFGLPEPGATYLLEQGSARAAALLARSAPSKLVPTPPQPTSAGDPSASARTVLAVPLGLPRLALETFDGQPASLFGITLEGSRGTGAPLLLVLWGSDVAECAPALQSLVAGADELRAAALDVLALSVDRGEQRQHALDTLRALDWPFPAGFATDQAVQVLELIEGTLHDSTRSLAVPSAYLIDAEGLLIATYLGRLDTRQVSRDVGLAGLTPQERRTAAVPFPGRWIAPPPEPIDEAVAARLASHGLERAAAEYGLARMEARELTAATFELGLGQARQRQGRLDEAIGHFRRALEADPALFEAARGLALALHSKGDYEAALGAYRAALALQPADPTARCNMGLVLLALGDLEGARAELEALRSLRSELADTLAERIRMVQDER